MSDRGDPGAAWAQTGAHALASGRLADAALALRRSVALDPLGLDSLSNLAAHAQSSGKDADASGWLQRLLSISALDVEALVALASVHPSPGGRARVLRRAVSLAPAADQGWIRTGAAWLDRDALASLRAFGRALALAPLSAPALIGSALAQGRIGERRGSLRALRRGLALAPGRVDGWDAFADPAIVATDDRERLQKAMRAVTLDHNRAAGWHRLGTCHWAMGRSAPAACCYRRALGLEPRLVEAIANLGAALRELGQNDLVLIWFSRSVAMAPDSAGAMTNLGTAMPPGAPKALTWHRRAIAYEPLHRHALNNLGSQHLARNEVVAASRWFDRALVAGYSDGEAQWNRGVARLVSGDLARGFADYEERWKLRAFMAWHRGFRAPLWLGEPGAGRTILAHAEQGLGDTIQCVRYLDALADRGFRVILECQPPLVRLMGCLKGVAAVVPKGGELPAFDTHVPLLSLPHRFGTDLSTIPSHTPYLSAPPSGRGRGLARGRHVGLVWAGNPEHKNDRNRSLDEEAFRRLAAGLAALPDVTLVPLQVGPRAADLDRLPLPAGKVERIEPLRDFADTAAEIEALDLVVGVDTSVMHLVGALARPGWLLLPFSPDWRWLLERSDTPWYPSLRLYRQRAPEDWMSVISSLLDDLRGIAARKISDRMV